MITKHSLATKLTGYSALAAAIIASKKSDAQIIYTGLNPTVQLISKGTANYDSSYHLDLNNDGVIDFEFNVIRDYVKFLNGHETLYTMSAIPFNSNKLDADTADAYGKTINNNLSWKSFAPIASHSYLVSNAISHTSNYGAFLNIKNKYLPLKLVRKGQNYFGWVRLSVNTADSLAIIDYAYNSTPNTAITAGNTGCSTSPITPIITQSGDTLKSTSATNYEWYLGDSLLNETTQYIVTNKSGYYSVLTTDVNGCLTQSTAFPDSVTVGGINVAIPTERVFIYSYNKLVHVLLSDNNLLGSSINVYNTLGQLVYKMQANSFNTVIDLSSQPAEMYIIQIATENSSIVKKIITQ